MNGGVFKVFYNAPLVTNEDKIVIVSNSRRVALLFPGQFEATVTSS
jgi:hypothetical protein